MLTVRPYATYAAVIWEPTMPRKAEQNQPVDGLAVSDLERDLAKLTTGDGFASIRNLMQQMSDMDTPRRVMITTLPACNSIA